MQPGLAAALRQPGERLCDGLAARLQQVGQFVDGDNQAWELPACPVTALHLSDQILQRCSGYGCILDDALPAPDMGQPRQRSEPAAFGVEQHQLDVAGMVVHGERKQ